MAFVETIKFSDVAKRLKIGPMKRLYKYYNANSINLAGGLPMESCFPFEQATIKLNSGEEYTLVKGANLQLNYHRGTGIPSLADWINEHVIQVHDPSPGYQTCITCGSTDAWAKIVTLVNTDSVLFDQYAYGTAVTTAEALGKQPIGVPGDSHGMLPGALRNSILLARDKGLSPRLLYLVPVGQNPTGLTMSVQRKKEILAVCSEQDIAIVEDDAYYYLYYGTEDKPARGVKDLPRTFLSLDEEGRVIRLDSCSKFLAPGMRVGWVTAPLQFIEKYVLLQEVSTNFPSSLSQSILQGLFNTWGKEGFNQNIITMQNHYRDQCSATISALKDSFKGVEVEFVRPECGMFVWLSFPSLSVSSFELFQHLAEENVIAVPGDDFYVSGVVVEGEGRKLPPCLRITFAASSSQKIREAVEKMAQKIKTLIQTTK